MIALKYINRYYFFLILLKLPLFANAQASTGLKADLDLMMEWFTGDFDNFQQVWKEKEDEIVDSVRHEHIHSIFARVSMPKLGKQTFFVKQYMDGDTNKIYRQRVYHFYINKEEGAIQLDIYSFKSPEEEKRYGMTHHHPELVKDLGPEDFRNIPGCAVYWKRYDDYFIGYMKDKACHFTSRRSGKEIYVTDSLKLTKDEIWIRDEAYDAEGNYVFGHKAGIHHKLKKCRFFTGWMAVQKPDSEEYYVMRGIELHDQGKRVRLIDTDGTETKYYIELSQVVYQSGLEVLKLAIYEEGKTKAPAYVWANSNAERIGINMRSMTAGFALKK